MTGGGDSTVTFRTGRPPSADSPVPPGHAASSAHPDAPDPSDRAIGSSPAVLREVSVFYGEVIGLSKVSLSLEKGITGIVGPNGSGKSTLMRVLSGLIAPSEGRALVLGEPPFSSERVRRRTGFVPATECFFESLSARRNLEVAFLSHGRPRSEARARAEEALERVGLRADGKRRYGTWSRGMRQRLKLGLVLSSDCQVVLLDEPFLGVDPASRKHLRTAIQELGDRGRAILISSHVLHDVEMLTRRVGVLSHGRLLGMGEISHLLQEAQDSHPHRVRLVSDDPRALAARLAVLPHVTQLQLGDDGVLEFVTTQPDAAYGDLPRIIAETGCSVRRLQTVDDGLEAVYRHVTEGGANRL